MRGNHPFDRAWVLKPERPEVTSRSVTVKSRTTYFALLDLRCPVCEVGGYALPALSGLNGSPSSPGGVSIQNLRICSHVGKRSLRVH